MKKARFTEEQMVAILREADKTPVMEVLNAGRLVLADVSRAGDSAAATTAVSGRSDSEEPSKLRMVEIAPNVYELTPTASRSISSEASTTSTRVTRSETVPERAYRPSSETPLMDVAIEVPQQVYELGNAASAFTPAVARQGASADESPKARFGVEVSNGNGVQGMAGRMATELRSQGIGVTRLSNRRPFDQLRTEIEYRDGFLDSARKIGIRLPNQPSYVESGSLRDGISVRLVLGKDLNRNFALVDPNTSDANKLASLR